MSSIWDTPKPAKSKKPLTEELKQEILDIRKRNTAFKATNETDTYCVLVFSCTKDRNEFVQSVLNKKETYIDGYEFARVIGKSPVKPSVKLPKPLNK